MCNCSAYVWHTPLIQKGCPSRPGSKAERKCGSPQEPTFAFPIGKPKGAKSQPQAQQQRAPAIAPAAASSRPQSAAAAPPKQPAAGSASAAAASRAATPAAAGPGPGRGGGGVLSELPDLPSSITFEGTPVTAVLCRVPLPKARRRRLYPSHLRKSSCLTTPSVTSNKSRPAATGSRPIENSHKGPSRDSRGGGGVWLRVDKNRPSIRGALSLSVCLCP